ncbi:Tn3 family transposase (plasmid) [Klebsiella pneumoniae]|nr:Tn3 family transposase [Klebsiella pneumoniae]WBX45376.1 Tn3 family transposase [Klebsiella pneumoniae]
MTEQQLREEMVQIGASLFSRGYATGSAGNLSLLLPDGNLLATPTGACLGELQAQRLSVVTLQGEWISGDKPSKEVTFHRAVYLHNPACKAIVHLHISDQYAPFSTRVVNVGVRDSTYVLDGLLYHESDLRIEEHYTDTAGFTDHVFALMHLLGFRFAPRIRDLGETKLYVPQGVQAYPTLRLGREVILIFFRSAGSLLSLKMPPLSAPSAKGDQG